jgi:hypothetical protein
MMVGRVAWIFEWMNDRGQLTGWVDGNGKRRKGIEWLEI